MRVCLYCRWFVSGACVVSWCCVLLAWLGDLSNLKQSDLAQAILSDFSIMIAALLLGLKRGAYVIAPAASNVLCRMKS